MSTPSSPDPLQLANSDKENPSSISTSATSNIKPASSTGNKASASHPASSSQVNTRNNTTTRGRERGASTRGRASTAARRPAAAAAAAPSTSANAASPPSKTTTTMQASPRRSSRTRSRSRSTSMSVNGASSLQQYLNEDCDYGDDDNDDTYSVASSSATATRRGPARSSAAGNKRGQSNAGGSQASTATSYPVTHITDINAEDEDDDYASLPPSSRKPAARSTPNKKAASASASQTHALDHLEQHEDGHEEARRGEESTSTSAVPKSSQQPQQQRGRGPSIIQQSERPTQASFKDTSVNIATAFRTAAAVRIDNNGTNNAAILPPLGMATSQSITSTSHSTTTTNYGNGASRQAGPSNVTATSTIGFLSRAGDTEVPLIDTSADHADSQRLESEAMTKNPSGTPSNESQQSPNNNNTSASASKKRKSRQSSSSAANGGTSKGKAKDTALWKPSKDDLDADTDEYTSEGAITTDPEDLTKFIENPYGKKVYTVEYSGNGRRIVRRRQRKKVKGDGENANNDEDESEDEENAEEILLDDVDIEGNADATASPATRRRNAASRRGGASAASRGKRGAATKSSTTGRGARSTSVVDSVMSNDDTASQAPSQASQSVTSYYLHEPSENGAQAGTSQAGTSQLQPSNGNGTLHPEFKSSQQAGLVQTYPKADNFQPYFAYSTATLGGNNLRQAGRARRDTTLSTSTEGGGGSAPPLPSHMQASRILDTSRTGASSTASFDQRGSDYDYAEEEKMTAALLAAKERGITGKGIPEGRAILPDILLTRNYGSQPTYKYGQQHQQQQRQSALPHREDREMSLSALSDLTSSDVHPTGPPNYSEPQKASTSRLAPASRRGPAPPPKAPSIVSESTNHPPGQYETSSVAGDLQDGEGEESFAQRQAKKSLGRRLGEIVRMAFIGLYWSIAGPLQWIKKQDANTLWKSAGAVLLTALIIGSIYEETPSNHYYSSTPSVWKRIPFASPSTGHKHRSYQAPDSLPSNFDEVVQRLASLEDSVRSVTSQQHTTNQEQAVLLKESNKRLSEIESRLESEKRKFSKIRDSSEKQRQIDNEKMDSAIKGIKNRLDSFNTLVKSHEGERKSDSSDLMKLKSELGQVQKDLNAYKGRMDMLVTKTESALDNERIVKLAREAIEDILPARLAVAIDPKTGQLKIDPKFWQHLKDHFSSSSSSSSSPYGAATISWEDFLHSNSDKLRNMVHSEVDGQLTREVNEGAILSKKTFAEALERELRSLSHKVTQSTSEQLAHLSHELESKLSKFKHSTGSQEASKSIKISTAKGEDVTSLVNTLIDEALNKYSKDVLARPDFALYTAGGRVIPSLTSPSYEIRPSTFTGSLLARLTGSGVIRGKSPVTALHPDISTGQCWALNGPTGQLGILLSRRIYPTDVTVEHASKEVALDVSSAPRNFEVWGIVSDSNDLQRLSSVIAEEVEQQGNMLKLVTSTYDINASNNIQTFELDSRIQVLKIPISAIVFKILDNHGNGNLSCLYRVRVGGQIAELQVAQ